MSREKNDNDSDILFVHGTRADGEGFDALRARGGRLEAATITPLQEGRDVSAGEVISLSPRHDLPSIYDVKTIYGGTPAAGSGPPKVNSSDFRKNWGRVFGGKKPRKQLLN